METLFGPRAMMETISVMHDTIRRTRANSPPPRPQRNSSILPSFAGMLEIHPTHLADPAGPVEPGIRTTREGEPAYGADFFWFPLDHPARDGDHLVRAHATIPHPAGDAPPEGAEMPDFIDTHEYLSPEVDNIRLLVERFRQELSNGNGTAAQAPVQNPFARLSALLNLRGDVGDAVYSQEEFDRVLSEMIENTTGAGAAPAPASAIRSLPKKNIDAEMLGTEGTAECSICMDHVELGTEVVVLPCNHWFHYNCIQVWLNQHNTCPHCRRSIGSGE
ncbi:hypothetical protein N7495_004028 [Penicillium taxi]|uniref:uncharacterized protein n=1 Tax=Penicillium taxi TaxID=168475 RepID=UPI002545A0E8|nr:uncharacterized protein N7495_004028 [Penicillium taxi]KAJ5899284.1 hypothetical protein N7495_004028 [Penicillium taxi]